MSNRNRYRVAIIGTGRMGGLIEDEIEAGSFSKPYSYFCAYAAIAETAVFAIANRGAERIKIFASRNGATNTYFDYQTMIEKERPDIVSITTPSLFILRETVPSSAGGNPALAATDYSLVQIMPAHHTIQASKWR